mgnify:CR=1 FL=1
MPKKNRRIRKFGKFRPAEALTFQGIVVTIINSIQYEKKLGNLLFDLIQNLIIP